MAINITLRSRRHCRVFGFAAIIFLFLCYILYSLRSPLSIPLERHDDLKVVDMQATKDAAPLIPKIIHQTYKTADIPPQWKAAQKSCLDLNPDFEYMFWTDASADLFIATHYTWFYPTWTSYPHPIQRADALRYFVLLHYGGIYIDLDAGCNTRLTPLLPYPAWLPLTAPIGVSNDIMAARPAHPFFAAAVAALPAANRNLVSPYLTVMASTGPLFLSTVRREYLRENHRGDEALFTLLPEDYDRDAGSVFKSYVGSSWHEGDARVVLWAGGHVGVVVGLVVVGVVVAGWGAWRGWCAVLDRMVGRGARGGKVWV